MAKPKKTDKPAATVAKSTTAPVKDMASDIAEAAEKAKLAELARLEAIAKLSLADLVAAQGYILSHECRKARGDTLALWGRRREALKAEIQRRIIEAVG